MDHTEYVIGQTWLRPAPCPWAQEWRIMDVDRRKSVTFLHVTPYPISGIVRDNGWVSTVVFAEEMARRGAHLQ